MPNDALTQFLSTRAELKHNLVTYEADSRADTRPGGPGKTEIRMQAVRRDIAEYERAITALIPRRQDA
jgi:hypothetical protein